MTRRPPEPPSARWYRGNAVSAGAAAALCAVLAGIDTAEGRGAVPPVLWTIGAVGNAGVAALYGRRAHRGRPR